MNARILLLATLLLLAIQAWGQNNQLVGSWRINIDKTLAIMNSDAKEQYDTLSTELQSRAVSTMKDREFILEGSGDISVNWLSRNGPKTSAGRWTIDLSGNVLRITINNQTVSYDFEMASETEMIWRGKGKRGFFSNLYLQKI